MGRVAYIRNRLLLMVVVLFGVTLIIFSMVRLIPGDPAFLILGERATEETAARLREQLGLNEPLPTQYWLFISGIVRGDFGDSLLYRQPVTRLVTRRVPVSIFLATYAMILAAVFTMTFGILAAVKKGRAADHIIRVGFLFFVTTPSFWLGILLIMLLSLKLHLFPVAGYGRNFPGSPALSVPARPDPRVAALRGAHPQPARADHPGAARRLHAHRAGQGVE